MPTDATISCGSAPSSAPTSPKNRLKFLCSHGGKILPRPGADAQLKYVGGETRVISVPRDIPFRGRKKITRKDFPIMDAILAERFGSDIVVDTYLLTELMKKLTYLIDGEMILKYQLVSEDLDALVTVKSDEDVVHMFDEIDRYESLGCPRMRAFLFPANHVVVENQMEPLALEQRYIYSINGIISSAPNSNKQHPTIHTRQLGSLASSACSSPRSPDSCNAEAMNIESVIQNNHQNSSSGMHKIQSSPSICNLYIPQQSSHYVQLHHPHYYQAHHSGYRSPNPIFDAHRSGTPERLISVRSVGQGDGVRFQVETAPQYYYASRENRGNGCTHHDNCSHFSDRRIIDRQATLP